MTHNPLVGLNNNSPNLRNPKFANSSSKINVSKLISSLALTTISKGHV